MDVWFVLFIYFLFVLFLSSDRGGIRHFFVLIFLLFFKYLLPVFPPIHKKRKNRHVGGS